MGLLIGAEPPPTQMLAHRVNTNISYALLQTIQEPPALTKILESSVPMGYLYVCRRDFNKILKTLLAKVNFGC